MGLLESVIVLQNQENNDAEEVGQNSFVFRRTLNLRQKYDSELSTVCALGKRLSSTLE